MENTTIRLQNDDVVAELVPIRGGMVTRLAIGGEEILYMDRATLADPDKKVRGGVPILFPCAGSLENNTFKHQGRSYPLVQHGFARDLGWATVGQDGRVAELRLASDEYTKDLFPFGFDIRFKYRASGNTLNIEQTFSNLEHQPMPFHAGLHPYFLVPDGEKAKVKVSTDATRAFDNATGQEVAFSAASLDLTADNDLVLLDHGAAEILIERPGKRTLRLTWGEPYRFVVLWTQKGADFVCVEPWTAPPNALNTGDGIVHIGARQARKTFFAITALE